MKYSLLILLFCIGTILSGSATPPRHGDNDIGFHKATISTIYSFEKTTSTCACPAIAYTNTAVETQWSVETQTNLTAPFDYGAAGLGCYSPSNKQLSSNSTDAKTFGLCQYIRHVTYWVKDTPFYRRTC